MGGDVFFIHVKTAADFNLDGMAAKMRLAM
jgi:hypothetical protein